MSLAREKYFAADSNLLLSMASEERCFIAHAILYAKRARALSSHETNKWEHATAAARHGANLAHKILQHIEREDDNKQKERKKNHTKRKMWTSLWILG